MRAYGKIKLGFYPLPLPEARRLKNCLVFPPEFSALDPCVGDGVAFMDLLEGTQARRYGIEIDAYRVEQAARLGIETLQANTLDVRCPAEALSLLYLNPPYDFETGLTNNQRLESVFLEHTYRWLKPGGVLVFVIPQPQLRRCAKMLCEHFTDLFVYRLTEPASVQYQQVAVLGVRCKRHQHPRDSVLLESVRWLETLASKADLEALADTPAVRYELPGSGPVVFVNAGIPLDELEDLLLRSTRLTFRGGPGISASEILGLGSFKRSGETATVLSASITRSTAGIHRVRTGTTGPISQGTERCSPRMVISESSAAWMT
jgi:hypothetical protein